MQITVTRMQNMMDYYYMTLVISNKICNAVQDQFSHFLGISGVMRTFLIKDNEEIS